MILYLHLIYIDFTPCSKTVLEELQSDQLCYDIYHKYLIIIYIIYDIS